MKKQILIADGYNIIGNWPELNKLKQNDHLADARDRLLQILSEYRKFREIEVILVFDAMYVPGIKQSYVQYNLEVVFTDEDETADSYIEGLAGKLMSPITQVTVVSSDQAEQWTIFSRGALRVSSHDFYREIRRTRREIDHDAKHYHDRTLQRNMPWNPAQLDQLAQMRDALSAEKDD
ncbi:NYN domain-containing protein [Latilactobacillus curvatus]|jgi:predicted RNA-binding protein with PIN domain|uniref:NYN domain-containing protein n=1 Tax=Latilactobacillus curvatus TaxID=28038 RepID=UPI001C006C2A|nr:NYN domain-containing protein [Latilactobacillus curvatus]QWF35436.1 NYN domain-containing protein [Latilactobacillus curvatus]